MIPDPDAEGPRLLAELRYRFPIVERPFEEIGQRIGLSESETLERTSDLVSNGTIRRIGYMVGMTGRSGRATTLVGMKVAPDRIGASAAIVDRSNSVTHDYLRDHEFNLWFTLGAADRPALDAELQLILDQVRPLDWIELPTVRTFKLRSPAGSD